MNMDLTGKMKKPDGFEYNSIVKNFKTKSFGRLDDLFATIKTFLFFIFKTRKLQSVSKIKLILSPNKLSSEKNFVFEYKCDQNPNKCKFL